MKKVITEKTKSRRFVAVYGFEDPRRRPTRELSEPRESVEAVMADLADKQEREGRLCLVQIVDLSVSEPVEPHQATLARLRRSALL